MVSRLGGVCASWTVPAHSFARGQALLGQTWCSQHAHFSSSEEEFQYAQTDVVKQLVERGLKHVPVCGWTNEALQQAALEMGLSPAAAGLLPRRESHLVEHFIHTCNQALEHQAAQLLQQGALQNMKTRQKLATLIRMRLEMLQPHINTWPQALAVLSRPANVPHGIHLLTQLVDGMWAAAGDTATDMSWYTKRATLAGVYTSTELYMLTDFSPGFEDTWQAMERRFDDVQAMGKWAAGLRQSTQQAWQHAASRATASSQGVASKAAQTVHDATAAAAAKTAEQAGLGKAAQTAAGSAAAIFATGSGNA